MDFSGQTVLITGASRGIGAAAAEHFATLGAQVVLTARSEAELAKLAEKIGSKALAIACDIADFAQVQAAVDQTVARFGRLDILVNNAATNPFFGPAVDLPPRAFDKTVEINLKGPYYMLVRAVPLMAKSGGGSVVNVASIAALISLPGQAVYSMTKAGLVSLTRSFAKEYGTQGVRVNAILPGVVETRLASALIEDPSMKKWLARLPAGRAGQPDDMVAGVLYLVSDQAAYTTGTTLIMDGGATLG